MDKITSFLLENWVYVVGAFVVFGKNLLDLLKPNYEKLLDLIGSQRKKNEFVQKIVDGVKSVGDAGYKNDVIKDLDCFTWIKTRAVEAGDQSLFEELENVNKKFYASVYSTLYNPTLGTKQLPK